MTDKKNHEQTKPTKQEAPKESDNAHGQVDDQVDGQGYSDQTVENTSPQNESNIGRQLQNQRRALELSTQQVSDQIRIRTEILEDMEANKFAEMQEPVYTRGFLRTYANFLDLDGNEMVHLLDNQEQLNTQKDISLPTPAAAGSLPTRKMLLFSALALILLGLAWQNLDFLVLDNFKLQKKQVLDQPQVTPVIERAMDKQDVANQSPAPAFQTPQMVESLNHKENQQGKNQPENNAQKNNKKSQQEPAPTRNNTRNDDAE